jgi:hypothetical protein
VVTIDYSHFHAVFATFLIWVMLMLGGSGNNRARSSAAFIIWGVWSGTAFAGRRAAPGAGGDLARPARARALPAADAHRLLLILILLYRPKGLIGEERFVSHTSDATRGGRRRLRAEVARDGARGPVFPDPPRPFACRPGRWRLVVRDDVGRAGHHRLDGAARVLPDLDRGDHVADSSNSTSPAAPE